MTIVNATRTERLVFRQPQRLWHAIQRDWAGDDQQRWKVLVCIHLRLHCQWSLEMIGRALGHPRGRVLRLINEGLLDVREGVRQRAIAVSTVEGAVPPLPPDHIEEIASQRALLEDEAARWKQLLELARLQAVAAEESPPPRRVIAGSLRDRIGQLLQSVGPASSTKIARLLKANRKCVRHTLKESPEFVGDDYSRWSAHPFAGQYHIGPQTEPLPRAAESGPVSASLRDGQEVIP